MRLKNNANIKTVLARRHNFISNIFGETKAKKVTSCIQGIKNAANFTRGFAACLLLFVGCLFLMFAGLTEPEDDINE